jgi:hypothetical protein
LEDDDGRIISESVEYLWIPANVQIAKLLDILHMRAQKRKRRYGSPRSWVMVLRRVFKVQKNEGKNIVKTVGNGAVQIVQTKLIEDERKEVNFARTIEGPSGGQREQSTKVTKSWSNSFPIFSVEMFWRRVSCHLLKKVYRAYLFLP